MVDMGEGAEERKKFKQIVTMSAQHKETAVSFPDNRLDERGAERGRLINKRSKGGKLWESEMDTCCIHDMLQII